ncbi:MAG: DMT family transporter [Hyphomicrobiales bacterium]
MIFFRWLFNQPYLLLSITMLCWSGNVVLGRAVAGEIPPVLLAQIRWIGAALILAPFAWPHVKRDWPTIRQHIPLLSLLALTGITAYNTLAYLGLQYTTAINGLLIQSAAPLIIGFWSLVLFRDALTRKQLFGTLISMIGVLVILTRGELSLLLSLAFNVGDILFFLAFLFYGLYSAVLRKRPQMHWLSFLWVAIAVGAILLLPALVLERLSGAQLVTFDWCTFGAFAYVIIFASIVAYMCFNRGVELIGANRSGPFFHLMPLFGSILAVLLLGEKPALFHAIGYAFILVGVVTAQHKSGANKG